MKNLKLRGLQKDVLLWITKQNKREIKKALFPEESEQIFNRLLDEDSELKNKVDEIWVEARRSAEFWKGASVEEKRHYWANIYYANNPNLKRIFTVEEIVKLRGHKFDRWSTRLNKAMKKSGSTLWSPERYLGRKLSKKESRNRSSYTRALNALECKGLVELIRGEGQVKPKTLWVRIKRDAYKLCYLLLLENI